MTARPPRVDKATLAAAKIVCAHLGIAVERLGLVASPAPRGHAPCVVAQGGFVSGDGYGVIQVPDRPKVSIRLARLLLAAHGGLDPQDRSWVAHHRYPAWCSVVCISVTHLEAMDPAEHTRLHGRLRAEKKALEGPLNLDVLSPERSPSAEPRP